MRPRRRGGHRSASRQVQDRSALLQTGHTPAPQRRCYAAGIRTYSRLSRSHNPHRGRDMQILRRTHQCRRSGRIHDHRQWYHRRQWTHLLAGVLDSPLMESAVYEQGRTAPPPDLHLQLEERDHPGRSPHQLALLDQPCVQESPRTLSPLLYLCSDGKHLGTRAQAWRAINGCHRHRCLFRRDGQWLFHARQRRRRCAERRQGDVGRPGRDERPL